MSNPIKNEDKILRQVTLQKRSAIDPDFLAQQSKTLITLLEWLLKGPPLMGKLSLAHILELPPLKVAAVYLNYYKTHLVILAKVLASVKKAEPIDSAIREIEGNLRGYVKQTAEVANKMMREVPSSPWKSIGSPAIIVLIPLLKQDPRFVQEWNAYLNLYQALIQNGLAVTDFLAEQGRDIERTTPQKITELKEEVVKIEASIGLDVVVKYRYKERLDWIYLSLTTEVQPARKAAEDAGTLLQKALVEAQKIQRL